MTFIGSSYKAIDQKNRVVLPVKWRRQMDGVGTVVLELKDDHLELWTMETLAHIAPRDMANCEMTGIDTCGRMLLPNHWISKLGWKGTLTFVGSGDHIKIYLQSNQ